MPEHPLQRSELELSDFVDDAAIGLHWVAVDGRILWANRAVLELLGYSEHEYIGRHISEFYVDRAAAADVLARLNRNETLRNYETRLRANDGSIKHVVISSNVYRKDGQFVHSRCFTRDITDRKRAEERLRILAEASKQLARSLDYADALRAAARIAVPSLAEWCVVHANDTDGEPHIEVAHADGVDGDVLRSLARTYRPDPALAEHPMGEAIRMRQPLLVPALSVAELDDIARDPAQLALLSKLGPRSMMVVPLIARDHDLGTLVLASRAAPGFTEADLELARELADRAAVTFDNCRLYAEAIEAREQLRAADRERTDLLSRERHAREGAEAASRAKDEFLAMLGHELRNPLSPILTALQLMEVRLGTLAQRERTIIRRQVEHLVRLVDDLLDVSRITRGRIELKKRPTELSAVVGQAIEMSSPLLEQRKHELSTHIPAGLLVEGDNHRLAQVISNLLVNAAKYTEPGGRIDLRARPDAGCAVLSVRDTGMGIPPELMPRLFGEFVQGERAVDRAQGGLGLGLAIARSLVELHGGTITAHSEGVGFGSEFIVTLPLAELARDGRNPTPLPPSRDALTRGRGVRRILVVDDNPDAAEVLADALAASGHVTHASFDGPSALEAAAQFQPDVALVDIGLPVMDGYELARRLRQIPGLAALRLVAVTGYGQPSDRDRSRRAGFDEHLVKPVGVEEIEPVLARLS